MDTLKSYGVGPSEFTKDPSFAAFKKDPDFNLAIKGKYVKAAAAEKSASKKAASKKATPTNSAKPKHPKGLVVWNRKPSKKVVYEATRAFFDALSAGTVDAARSMLEHDERTSPSARCRPTASRSTPTRARASSFRSPTRTSRPT